MLDNGGEGSAATTASTPTAPGGVTLRAVRQVVTVLGGRRKKKEEILDGDTRQGNDDGKATVFWHFPRFAAIL